MRIVSNVFFSIALILASPASADEITPHDAINHVGEISTVVGVVSQVSATRAGTTFVNFAGRYPDHVFYAVILREDASLFPSVYSYMGQTIAISGKIALHKGKPQIVVSSRDQVEIR